MSVVPTTWYYAGVFDNWMVKMATSRRLNLELAKGSGGDGERDTWTDNQLSHG